MSLVNIVCLLTIGIKRLHVVQCGAFDENSRRRRLQILLDYNCPCTRQRSLTLHSLSHTIPQIPSEKIHYLRTVLCPIKKAENSRNVFNLNFKLTCTMSVLSTCESIFRFLDNVLASNRHILECLFKGQR